MIFLLYYSSCGKLSLEMVPFFILYAIILFQNWTKAKCPIIENEPKNFDDFDLSASYHKYKFKLVDDIVQSPFCALNIKGTSFRNRTITNKCFSRDLVVHNEIELVNFNSETQKFIVKYNEQKNNYFCNSQYKMDEISLLDFENDKFISFYGCQMLTIGGISRKFEGVLTFVNFNPSSDSWKDLPDLIFNETYNILLEQANITVESLQTWNGDETSENNTCTKLTDLQHYCKNYKINEFFGNVYIFAFGLSALILFGASFSMLSIWLYGQYIDYRNRVHPI